MNNADSEERNEINIETGKRIRIERVLQGLTQEEVAEKLGVSERQYRRYENGESGIGWNIIYQFDDIGFDPCYILFGVVEADYYVTRGFEIMPEEEYVKVLERFQKIMTHGKPSENEALQIELCSLLDYCAKYGREHHGEKILRESEPCRVLTDLHETLAAEAEIKNHHLHVN